MMSRIALLLATVFTASSLPLKGEEAKRPNILFLFADDQRFDTLGCYGHPIIKTPTIDAIAERGVRFENAFVQHSICWVSRTTVLTGLTPRLFGTPENPDAARADALTEMMPDLLRGAGYRVGHLGKWHFKAPQGFDPAAHYDVFEKIGRNPYHKPMPDGTTRHETELICDGAIDFLQSQDAEQPFCLHLWFNAAHAEDGDKEPGTGHFPWPKAVDGMYEDIEIPAPRLDRPEVFAAHPEFLKTSINRERYHWRWDTPEKYQTNIRAYFRMISGIDTAVARVMKTLEEQGLADNTIIVYTADNGFYMGDRGFAGKWSHYDQSLHVPMVIADPREGGGRGTTASEMVLNLDLPSTFLDWAGVEVPDSYQGQSLAPLVRGESPAEWREEFFCEHVVLAPKETWEGVRSERYKYARYFDQDFEFLHDLEKDPDELINLATDPEAAPLLQEMRAKTDAMVEQYGGNLAPMKDRPQYPYNRKSKKPKK